MAGLMHSLKADTAVESLCILYVKCEPATAWLWPTSALQPTSFSVGSFMASP